MNVLRRFWAGHYMGKAVNDELDQGSKVGPGRLVSCRGGISSSTPPGSANRLWTAEPGSSTRVLGHCPLFTNSEINWRASASMERPLRAARTWSFRLIVSSRLRIVIVAIQTKYHESASNDSNASTLSSCYNRLINAIASASCGNCASSALNSLLWTHRRTPRILTGCLRCSISW